MLAKMKYPVMVAVLTAALSTAVLAVVAKTARLQVTSSFKNGDTIPKDFTADGADISPPISWNGIPTATKSVALICSDPDAPGATFYHWLMYNIEPKCQGFGEGVPKLANVVGIAKQGTNDFMTVGYRGPAPPRGKIHHYHFKVIALDIVLPLLPGARKHEVLQAIQGHELASGELIGTYSR